ncbi:MAG: NPCBM/NEW2 domain-containing protein [Planctomycetales bacterium]
MRFRHPQGNFFPARSKTDGGRLGDGWNPPRKIPTEQILRVEWPAERSLAHWYRRPQVLLVNGDRLNLQIEQWDEEALRGKWPDNKDWPVLRIPLEFVKGVILQPGVDLKELAERQRRILDHKAAADLVWLKNGDQIGGQILRLEHEKFLIQRDNAERPLPLQGMSLIAVNPQLSVTAPASVPAKSAIVTLSNGSRLTVSNWARNGDRFAGETFFKTPIDLPVSALASLRPVSADAVSIADLEPVQFEHTPFLSSSTQLRKNLNVQQGPLVMHGREFPRGLGMQTRSSATYSLDGRFRLFLATVGVDDLSGKRGSVQFRVLADGQSIYQSDLRRGGSPPLSFPPLKVEGIRQLTLVVDFADEGDVLDNADWGDALLIR